MSIQLTAIGSRISVEVGPAAIPEAYGRVAVRHHLLAGPLLATFTEEAAQQLVAAIGEELEAAAGGGAGTPARTSTAQ